MTAPATPENTGNWFNRMRAGLGFPASQKLEADALERLEERLLQADVGVPVTQQLIAVLESQIKSGKVTTWAQANKILREEIEKVLAPVELPLQIPKFIRPFIILVVGVNGAGKTTSIAKLAEHYKKQKLSVLLAAGDTFRAAAVQQLQTWGDRNGVQVIAQGQNADSASVIFDAVQAAKARNIDVIIADTAGRLHTQDHLMEELRKVKRVVQKYDAYAPHEVMLVVDANTGQNALNQAVQFHQAIGLTGITVTKLDGTARGGIVLAIAKRMALPIRYLGMGEKSSDLVIFNRQKFAEALAGSE